jgi:alpha-mannosidase
MSIEDVNAVIKRWRTNVKNKFRGIASFGERAQMRFDQIKARIYPQRVTFNNWVCRQGIYNGPGQYTFRDKKWKPIKIGESWGGEDTTAFFRQKIKVPADFAGKPIALQIFLGGDSLVTVNGKPFHGLDIFRNELRLTPKARAGEVLDIEIESYMNFGGSSAKTNELLCSDLVTVDTEVSDAYWDLWCAAKLLEIPDIDIKLRDFVETNLWDAMKHIPLQETDEAAFRKSVLKARRMIRSTVYATDRFKGKGLMHLVGHSHLDVVFMWPYREFIRKVGRTHATMLRLMEQYPEFRFSQSQAKIYADMKRYYPALFDQVKRRVKEGRWEPLGAFWVEPDCNLISGESFVRQIIHGQRFFRENFGRVSRTCWQPDVFGLSWVIPQILARSGVKYFISNKFVPWSDTNPWTINTFWWEGFDGSRVLTVVPPGHFIGTVDPDVLDKQWRNFNDKEKIGETFHIYGWGDGGGGVDPEMLESAKRYKDLPGLVPMRFSSVEEGLDRIGVKAAGAELPVLRDEIYLEAHRGTYTHRGLLKKLNRRVELLYREAELLASMAWTRTRRYPTAEIDEGWKIILDNQFHDALPGTHISKVYPEILEGYRRATEIGNAVRHDALRRIAGPVGGAADSLLLFNSMLFPRGGCASVPETAAKGARVADLHGHPLPQQTVKDLDGSRRRLFIAPETPPVGFRVLRLTPGRGACPRDPSLRVSANTLENALIKATFNRDGELVSLFDKENKHEMVPHGRHGNVFQMYEDTPGRYDAWDIVETYMDHPINIAGNATISVDETGPLRVSLRVEKQIGKSTLVQRIALSSGSRDLQFETQIDWVERQRLLKVAFPVAVNANFATFDIAYGNMTRPTFANNSRDRARFELPAHQWMDLSQSDFGLSVLNDCKYGCDVRENTMRLTLLKGSIHPDPKADMETHRFTYALRPHVGDWRQSGTIEAAAAMNHPLLVEPVKESGLKVRDGQGLLSCTAPNLTLEAVKRSEDGRALIVRLTDRHNVSSRAEITFDRPVKRAWSCNLMEDKEQVLKVVGNRVRFGAQPYEIVTLWVEFRT